MEIATKLWKHGGSWVTVVPHPMLFNLDLTKKQKVIWDAKTGKIRFEVLE